MKDIIDHYMKAIEKAEDELSLKIKEATDRQNGFRKMIEEKYGGSSIDHIVGLFEEGKQYRMGRYEGLSNSGELIFSTSQEIDGMRLINLVAPFEAEVVWSLLEDKK